MSKMKQKFGGAWRGRRGRGVEELKASLQLCCTKLWLSVISFAGSELSWDAKSVCIFPNNKNTSCEKDLCIGPEEKEPHYRCTGVQPVLETVTLAREAKPNASAHRSKAKAQTAQGQLLPPLVPLFNPTGSSIRDQLCSREPSPMWR